MANQKQEDTEAKNTFKGYSAPVTSGPADTAPLTEEEQAEISPAPIGGAEGSNFAGGTEGKEDPTLAGREDYRGFSPEAHEVAPEASVDNRNKEEKKRPA